MPSATEPPLTRAQLEQALLDAIGRFDFDRTRFCRLLASARCPRPILQRFGRETYRGASLFCANLADLAESAPDSEARLILLENLLEEEAVHIRAGRGVVVRPEQGHRALALRFLKACGGGDPEVSDYAGAAAHPLVPGWQLIGEGRWLEAVSFLLIGQEMKFAAVAERLFGLFRSLGFRESDLAFFAVHVDADQKHGREALDLVLDRALTAAEQQACIAAAGAGAQHWFEMHGGAPVERTAA